MSANRKKLLASSSELVRSLISAIGDNARRAIFVAKGQPNPVVADAEAQRLIDALSYRIDRALSRYVQLHRIIEDAEKCRLMAGRFPWRGSTISKSDHFYFVWFNFTNQCYLFRERAKEFLNDMNALRRLFRDPESNVGPTLKKIDKALGEHIRHRGTHVHEWHNDHLSYSTFSIIEHLGESGDTSWAHRYHGHYQDTKFDMRWRIARSEEFMCEFFMNLEFKPNEQLVKYIAFLDRYLLEQGAHYPDPPKRPR